MRTPQIHGAIVPGTNERTQPLGIRPRDTMRHETMICSLPQDIFAILFALSGDTVKHYQGDYYHDSIWLRENAKPGLSFYYSCNPCGTYLSTDPRIGLFRGGTDEGAGYLVEISDIDPIIAENYGRELGYARLVVSVTPAALNPSGRVIVGAQ